MDPDSGGDVPPLISPGSLQERFEFLYDRLLRDPCFFDRWPSTEIPPKENSNQLKVFWGPEPNESDGNCRPLTSTSEISASCPAPAAESIPSKIKSLLLSLDFGNRSIWVQFWAPIATVSGNPMLSVLDQPYGVNQLSDGFLGYRHSCIQLASSVEDIDQIGPPGKVFTEGSSQECLNIERYSLQQFPLKNQAQSCGLVGYWALPLFQREDCHLPQICVGVLEILCFDSFASVGLPTITENRDFVYTRTHREECKQFHRELFFSQYDAMRYLKLAVPVDTYILWVPCICDGCAGPFSEYQLEDSSQTLSIASTKITQLFTEWPWFYWEMELDSQTRTFSVKKGKSLIGRAYSENKPCFFRDASQRDYPLVYSNPRPRFAIPLRFIHPKLPPLIWEIYIQRGRSGDYKDPGNLLKSLLSDFAEKLSAYSAVYQFSESEKLCVEIYHSNDDDYVFFDVVRREETMNGSETLAYETLPSSSDVQCSETDNADVYAQINVEATATIHECEPDQQPPPSLDQQPTAKASTQHTAFQTGKRTRKNAVETTKRSVFLDSPEEKSLELLQQYQDKKRDHAARDIGVSVPTFKRRCKVLGVMNWQQWREKRKVVTPNGSLDIGSEVANESDGMRNHNAVEKGVEAENSIAHNKNGKMTVKAAYKDDAVKFHLSSNAGVEDLKKELHERFELGSTKFKIKYQDKEDGDWIMIACDKDLRFHMDDLLSAGQTRMNLMILPITE